MSSHRVTRLNVTPVKGMRVQHPDQIELTSAGAVGDRVFLFADADGRLLSVPRLGALVRFTAGFEAATGRLAIRHDDGRICAGEVVLGEAVTVTTSAGRQIEGNVVEGPWSGFVARIAGHPLRLVRPHLPGDAADAAGVTLLGEASVRALERESGLGAIDSRRFRMLIEFDGDREHVEDEWEGRRVALGSAELRVGGPVPRCAATTRDPDGGERDLPTVRAIKAYRGLRDTVFGPGAPFGVYADVVMPGRVRLGDHLRVG
jgi:uncharacterized protein YcbX